jgi:hypothetical protein
LTLAARVPPCNGFCTSIDPGPRSASQQGWCGKIYRGSRRRLRRIKWHEHTPTEFWIFVGPVIVMLIVLILWLTKHPPAEAHHGWM